MLLRLMIIMMIIKMNKITQDILPIPWGYQNYSIPGVFKTIALLADYFLKDIHEVPKIKKPIKMYSSASEDSKNIAHLGVSSKNPMKITDPLVVDTRRKL